MNEALAIGPHQLEYPPDKESQEEFHQTLDIGSINRKELMFVTYGYIRHTFIAERTYQLMKAASNIKELVSLCQSISLGQFAAQEYLVLVQSIPLGSWLIVKSLVKRRPNTMCTVVGITVQIGRWIVCEGAIHPCAGSGMYWNEYLSEIERCRKRARNDNIYVDPRADCRTEMDVEEPIKIQEQPSSKIIVEQEEIAPKAEPSAD